MTTQKTGHQRSLRSLHGVVVTEYFKEHPDAKDGVLKAWYAYHAPHFRVMPEMPLHNFTNGSRESKCVWCGRSRELVRHDAQPAQCWKRPVIREIKDVVLDEEEHSMGLAARAQKDVKKLVEKMGVTGETLAVLHHTYGHDPETVATVIGVPPQMLADYRAAMETERARSRAAQVKEVITDPAIRCTDGLDLYDRNKERKRVGGSA